jgi:hypothetical protein
LEAVSWHHNHVQPRAQLRVKGKSHSKAARFVTVTGVVHGLGFPLAWRLYLRRKQIKKLNATRHANRRLRYIKLTDLVSAMLDEIAPHLPAGARVYVLFDALFDAWYASADFMNDICKRGPNWHSICAVVQSRAIEPCRFARVGVLPQAESSAHPTGEDDQHQRQLQSYLSHPLHDGSTARRATTRGWFSLVFVAYAFVRLRIAEA